MTSLSDEPKIISMAHALGVHEGDRVKGIMEFCRRKVRALMAGAGTIRSIEDLERIVCEKLHLTIIEVWSDDDLAKLIEKYAKHEKDIAFAGLRRELTDETFATLLQRRRNEGESYFSYVAVIDCRSGKAARRFFSRWHEIAHVLTTVEQLQFPLHRSTHKKDAVEKMMDLIAGDIGFFDPIFIPLLKKQAESGLTFDVAEKVRSNFCPTASMEATLNACASRVPYPVIVVQAAMGYKKAEERAMSSNQGELIPADKPTPQLRVSAVMPNSPARAMGLVLPRNMRVPAGSVIMAAMQGDDHHRSVVENENLNWWRTSDGTALRHAPVRVEALRVRDRVWAIIRMI